MPALGLGKNQYEDYSMKELNHYNALAEVFTYPKLDRNAFIGTWRETVKTSVPEMAYKLEAFIEHIQQKTVAAQQEYYIATFDVQALCYLDIGYVLYGEDYNRGIFMLNMKREQKKHDNDCGWELPDHLPNILTLLPKIEDETFIEELIFSILAPALEKMIEAFNSEDNVYKGMLEILLGIMESDYPESEFERFSFNSREKARSFECLPQWKKIK